MIALERHLDEGHFVGGGNYKKSFPFDKFEIQIFVFRRCQPICKSTIIIFIFDVTIVVAVVVVAVVVVVVVVVAIFTVIVVVFVVVVNFALSSACINISTD